MEPILLLAGLFWLGLLSPGPNFVLMVRTSLAHGAVAGLVTGLGMATGDAIYSGAGLLGMAALVREAQAAPTFLRLLGGLYIAWLGVRLIRSPGPPASPDSPAVRDLRRHRLFLAGLLTDLANPKTVVFFASIFAVVLGPDTPPGMHVALWATVVAVSVSWRALLAILFSRDAVRRFYGRCARWIDRACGGVLSIVGVTMMVTR